MIEYNNCQIEQVAIHRVGNKSNEEELFLSKAPLDIENQDIHNLLRRYFLSPFEDQEFYQFTSSNDDFRMNPIFIYSTEIFENQESFHQNSIKIAKHLYENSIHPNIKSGDLFITEFSNIMLDNKVMKVIGLFKSETTQPFLQVDHQTGNFSLNYDEGININKLDKGCLIFFTHLDEGYKVCIVDKSSKSVEARYWRDVFLNIKPCSDHYHHTKEFMKLTKNYITNKLSEEFDVEKADQIDMLNRSVSYFKNHDAFNQDEFEEHVFYDSNVIASFRNYNSDYHENHDLSLDPYFEISPLAVKKQERIFKSILKLDKNFHIYIHGDRSKIERGMDQDGRKFYKIYYDEEN